MKKFILGLLIPLVALGQSSENRIVEGAYFPNATISKNYIKNGSCDKNVNDITKTGSATLTSSATGRIKGAKSCAIDASASAELITWSTYTLEQELKGVNCEAKFKYLGNALLYKAYVLQGVTKITTDLQLETSTTNTKNVSINFPCGDLSAATTLVLEATGNGAAITVDEVYVGEATNFGSSPFVTSGVNYTPTFVGFGTVSGVSARSWRVGQYLFVEGAFTAGTTTATLATISLGHAGINGGLLTVPTLVAGSEMVGSWTSTAGNQRGVILVTPNSASVNLGLETSSSAGYAFMNGNAVTSSQSVTFNFKVPIAGWSASNAVTAGNQRAPTFTRLTSGTAQTYTVPPGAVFLKVTVQGGGGGGAGADTDNVFSGSGGGGGGCVIAGIVNPSASYLYTVGGGGAGSASGTSPAQGATGTASTFGSILTANGGVGGAGGTAGGSSGTGGGASATGVTGSIFSGNPGAVNNIAGAQTGSGGGGGCFGGGGDASKSTNGNGADGLANSGGGGAGGTATSGNGGNAAAGVIFIEEYYSYGNMPLFTGSVTSNTQGSERIERARVDNAGSCVLSTQSGSWVSSVSRPGTGECLLNVASGVFSAAPTCVVNQVGNNSGVPIGVCIIDQDSTATTVNVSCSNNGFTAADRNFEVVCMGPR